MMFSVSSMHIVLVALILIIAARGQQIKIAFTCSEYRTRRIIGGLAYALDKIANFNTALSTYDFELRFLDSDCDGKEALGRLIKLLENGYIFNLAVGPECSTELYSAALLTSKLNVLTLGFNSAFHIVSDKSVYTTLVRGVTTTDSDILCLVELVEEFSWTTFCIFSFQQPLSEHVAEFVTDTLNGRGYVVYWFRSLYEEANVTVIRQEMIKAKTRCRVLIFTNQGRDNDLTEQWTIAIYEEDMHNGDYVFIWLMLETFSYYYFDDFDDWFQTSLSDEYLTLKVLENVLLISIQDYNDTHYDYLRDLMEDNQEDSEWPRFLEPSLKTPRAPAINLYELMRLYYYIANDLIQRGEDPTDGETILQKARNSFINDSYYGNIAWWNDKADRAADYVVYDFVKESNEFSAIATTKYFLNEEEKLSLEFEFSEMPTWGDGTRTAPRDQPVCGFYGEKCTSYNNMFITIGALFISATAILALVVAVAVKRMYPIIDWKVKVEDLQIEFKSIKSIKSHGSTMTEKSNIESSSFSVLPIPQERVTTYKGLRVMMKPIRKTSIVLNNKILKNITLLSSLSHNNITRFIGANLEAPNICVLWEFCSKGSLTDIIASSIFINLDNVFKFSLATDIIAGLQYIHKYMKYHGNLRSSNVVIDSRWTAKLTDFGLEVVTIGQEPKPDVSEDKAYQLLYWTAPELLLVEETSGKLLTYLDLAEEKWPKSKEGDIYSVGIIFKELFCVNSPYKEMHDIGMKSKAIIGRLHSNCMYRPNLKNIDVYYHLDGKHEDLKKLICDCWSSDPENRPPASEVLQEMGVINPLRKTNLMDQIVDNMQMYSNELERLVKKSTAEFLAEIEKCDKLLETMLPSTALKCLHEGTHVKAELFESCTLLVSGIANFVDFVFKITAEEVIVILNDMYSMFDHIVQWFDLYKVGSSGDIYVLASGLPQKNGLLHIANIADCALSLLHLVNTAHEKRYISKMFQLKIGIHTGSIMAGIIGTTVPKYDIYGDSINTTSRMMTKGKAMRIQMSASAYEALSNFGGYHVADRGFIPIKGKGEMHTYWLCGKEDFPMKSFEKQFENDEIKPVRLPVTSATDDSTEKSYIEEPVILQDNMIRLMFAGVSNNDFVVISQPQVVAVSSRRRLTVTSLSMINKEESKLIGSSNRMRSKSIALEESRSISQNRMRSKSIVPANIKEYEVLSEEEIVIKVDDDKDQSKL